MSSSEYNQLLKFLYFEGYADSYDEAENLLEEMTDEEFEELIEGFKEADLQKMKQQEYKHSKKATSQSGGSRGDAKNRASKISSIRGAIERGEDPRADTYGGARTARGNAPEDHRAAFSKNPLNNPPRKVKEPGVKKEETEMQEQQYRTTASGRRVRWDEDEATDNAVSDMLQKRREAAAKKAATARLTAKGILPIRKPQQNEEFESYVENLQNEGYDLSNWTWDGIEEFYIAEAKKEFPSDTVKRQSAKHMRNFLTRPNSAVGQRSKQKSKKMDAIRSTVEVGDDPRNTMHGQDLRKIRREEFEEVVEYLFVEGYADTIENAELMAESISETWVNEILEAKADPEDAVKRLRVRNMRLQQDHPEVPSGRDQTEYRRKKHQELRGVKTRGI